MGQARSAWGDDGGWSVDSIPMVSVGSAEGSGFYDLYRVREATRLENGHVLVADEGSTSVRWFDGNGRFLFKSGRMGKGPGEYTRIDALLAIPPDTLLVADAIQRRVTVLQLGTGALLGTYQIPADGPRGLPAVEEFFPSGDLLGYNWKYPNVPTPGPMAPDSILWYRIDRDSSVSPVLVAATHRAARYGYYWHGELTVGTAIFTHEGHATAAGEQVFVAPGDGYRVEVFDGSGNLVRSFGARRPRRPVDQRMHDRYVEYRVERANYESNVPELRRVFSERPVADSLPATSDILVDASMNVWIQDYRPRWDPRSTWTVFDSAGTWLGTVEFPRGFEALEIGEDYVLGIATDELDVERVLVYRLRKD